MAQPKRILICPLDWGLGHATRCIPVIRLLLQKNADVLVAAEDGPLALLQQEFPQLTFIPLKGYGIQYPRSGSMALKMLLKVPSILKTIKWEHEELERIIDQYKIDIIISDNRYGCWSKKVKSIFITHQLMIKTPLFEKAAHKKILSYISNYDECWIPDVPGDMNLSGDLSHKYALPRKAHFIGALSRFKKSDVPVQSHTYDVLAIVSGPEPQRSMFEELLLKQLQKIDHKALLVCGLPSKNQKEEQRSNVTIVSHLNADELQNAILNSTLIVARSGYSTIMDLAALGKKAVFVPTPGQTEQEYLAVKLMEEGIAYFEKQGKLQLERAVAESVNYRGLEAMEESGLLEKRIDVAMS